MFFEWIRRVERICDITSSRPHRCNKRPDRDHVEDVLWFGTIEFHEKNRNERCPEDEKPRVIQENIAIFLLERLWVPRGSVIVQLIDSQLVSFCHSPNSAP